MDWNGNLDSSIGKSEVRIPVQVKILLFKSKLGITTYPDMLVDVLFPCT